NRRIESYELVREPSEPFRHPLCESIFDRYISTLDITEITQRLPKRCDVAHGDGRLNRREDTNERHRWLLCARRKRPRCRAADHRDERASLHGGPVDPGLHPIQLSIPTMKTGKDIERNGKTVRQMCTAINEAKRRRGLSESAVPRQATGGDGDAR